MFFDPVGIQRVYIITKEAYYEAFKSALTMQEANVKITSKAGTTPTTIESNGSNGNFSIRILDAYNYPTPPDDTHGYGIIVDTKTPGDLEKAEQFMEDVLHVPTFVINLNKEAHAQGRCLDTYPGQSSPNANLSHK